MSKKLLEIITISKDDFSGLTKNLRSTEAIRQIKSVGQIIIDGSQSSVRDKNLKLCQGKSGLKYFHQSPQGIATAFNFGLNCSGSDWVWFLNSGDRVNTQIDPDLIIKILENTNSDICIFNHFSGSKLIRHPPLHSLWPPIPNWIPHPSTIIRKNLFEKVGAYSEKYQIASDYEKLIQFSSMNYLVDIISIPISIFALGGFSSDKKKAGRESLIIIFNSLPMIIKRYANRVIRVTKGICRYLIGR